MLPVSKQKLYHCIVDFLKRESSLDEYTADICESLEVARQCLESAFKVSGDVTPEIDLLSLFNLADIVNLPILSEPTIEDKAMAESLKTQGNACMSSENYAEAIACYTRAIELHPKNSVYFCNRAAAHSRLHSHDECIKDCERAIEIDANYSKAYGRMGLAYSSKGDYVKAAESYKKAISIEPNNTNFKENLAIAESQLRESGNTSVGGLLGGLGGAGGLDFNTIMNNPMMQSMAQRLMSDPNMQSTVSSMMQNMFGGDGAAGASTNTAPDVSSASADGSTQSQGGLPTQNSIDSLIRMGQQLAQQMQQSNPELVNTLRQQIQNTENAGNPQQQPPSGNRQS